MDFAALRLLLRQLGSKLSMRGTNDPDHVQSLGASIQTCSSSSKTSASEQRPDQSSIQSSARQQRPGQCSEQHPDQCSEQQRPDQCSEQRPDQCSSSVQTSARSQRQPDQCSRERSPDQARSSVQTSARSSRPDQCSSRSRASARSSVQTSASARSSVQSSARGAASRPVLGAASRTVCSEHSVSVPVARSSVQSRCCSEQRFRPVLGAASRPVLGAASRPVLGAACPGAVLRSSVQSTCCGAASRACSEAASRAVLGAASRAESRKRPAHSMQISMQHYQPKSQLHVGNYANLSVSQRAKKPGHEYVNLPIGQRAQVAGHVEPCSAYMDIDYSTGVGRPAATDWQKQHAAVLRCSASSCQHQQQGHQQLDYAQLDNIQAASSNDTKPKPEAAAAGAVVYCEIDLRATAALADTLRGAAAAEQQQQQQPAAADIRQSRRSSAGLLIHAHPVHPKALCTHELLWRGSPRRVFSRCVSETDRRRDEASSCHQGRRRPQLFDADIRPDTAASADLRLPEVAEAPLSWKSRSDPDCWTKPWAEREKAIAGDLRCLHCRLACLLLFSSSELAPMQTVAAAAPEAAGAAADARRRLRVPAGDAKLRRLRHLNNFSGISCGGGPMRRCLSGPGSSRRLHGEPPLIVIKKQKMAMELTMTSSNGISVAGQNCAGGGLVPARWQAAMTTSPVHPPPAAATASTEPLFSAIWRCQLFRAAATASAGRSEMGLVAAARDCVSFAGVCGVSAPRRKPSRRPQPPLAPQLAAWTLEPPMIAALKSSLVHACDRTQQLQLPAAGACAIAAGRSPSSRRFAIRFLSAILPSLDGPPAAPPACCSKLVPRRPHETAPVVDEDGDFDRLLEGGCRLVAWAECPAGSDTVNLSHCPGRSLSAESLRSPSCARLLTARFVAGQASSDHGPGGAAAASAAFCCAPPSASCARPESLIRLFFIQKPSSSSSLLEQLLSFVVALPVAVA
uniref:Protein kinase domain-containing protein n=1 Tax=Macrostomum lignano TaxID=282301 RepID=A0A1I8FBA1_9PLAT